MLCCLLRCAGMSRWIARRNRSATSKSSWPETSGRTGMRRKLSLKHSRREPTRGSGGSRPPAGWPRRTARTIFATNHRKRRVRTTSSMHTTSSAWMTCCHRSWNCSSALSRMGAATGSALTACGEPHRLGSPLEGVARNVDDLQTAPPRSPASPSGERKPIGAR